MGLKVIFLKESLARKKKTISAMILLSQTPTGAIKPQGEIYLPCFEWFVTVLQIKANSLGMGPIR